ncbi:MAG TPA: patatin-like phospholipase family protein [Roseiflexaceae bacterium]|nr:patatin-like phospholipase family protein [Roseiflexaceae bacterium]
MHDTDVPAQRSKTALVLAGGGVSGAVYEIGALRALDDLLHGFSVTDFDIFVGTSAGALVAACLANGLTPRAMMHHLEMPLDGLAPLRMRDLFALDRGGLVGRGLRLPEALLRTLLTVLAARGHMSLLDVIETLALALPGGLYDSSALDRYLAELLSRPGLSNDFRRLACELRIIATDLDTGERVVFGERPLDAVPISRAVAASAAVPLVYRPLRIGGRDYVDGGVRGNASLDVAIERGAQLIVCVNPLVPYDQDHASEQVHIRDLGAPGIANQVFRTFVHAGLHYHLKQIQRRHPEVDVVLIEPARDDIRMFAEMPMKYASRTEVARHGFESVARQLAERYAEHRALFARHGIRMERRHAAARLASVSHQLAAPAGARELRAALERLEGVLTECSTVQTFDRSTV